MLDREHRYYVYMAMSNSRRALYVGMTNNLERRIWEHKNSRFEGFTSEYNAHRLVYYESFDDVGKAINREKQLKGWRREKKAWLIERVNPTYKDLSADWGKPIEPPQWAIRKPDK
jgi:putative endonuclease